MVFGLSSKIYLVGRKEMEKSEAPESLSSWGGRRVGSLLPAREETGIGETVDEGCYGANHASYQVRHWDGILWIWN